MPDYKKMYHATFNALTDAERLISQAGDTIKKAQHEAEKLYVDAADDDTVQSVGASSARPPIILTLRRGMANPSPTGHIITQI